MQIWGLIPWCANSVNNPFFQISKIGFCLERQACRWMALSLAPGPDSALIELLIAARSVIRLSTKGSFINIHLQRR